jgi:hypothetical protein
MPDARRSRSLAREMKAHEQCHHRYTASIRHSLHNSFTVSFVLSGDRALLPPSFPRKNRALTQTFRAATYST